GVVQPWPRRDAALDCGGGSWLDQPAERRDEFVAGAEMDAVSPPYQPDVRGGGEELAECRQRVGAVARMRLGPDLLEAYPRRGRRLERDVAARLGQRDQRHAAVVRFRARDQVLGGAHAGVP